MKPAQTGTFNLERFISAQQPVYASALSELKDGAKLTHWMWFVFPQAEGLGHSEMSQRYAIRSMDEAIAYLAHPLLGVRLGECPPWLRRSVLKVMKMSKSIDERETLSGWANGPLLVASCPDHGYLRLRHSHHAVDCAMWLARHRRFLDGNWKQRVKAAVRALDWLIQTNLACD